MVIQDDHKGITFLAKPSGLVKAYELFICFNQNVSHYILNVVSDLQLWNSVSLTHTGTGFGQYA